MEKKKIAFIIIGSILLLVLIYFGIDNAIKQSKITEENNKCLQEFADEYCNSLNYSRAIYWGNGWGLQYFKCASERDYQGFGEFVSTQEERDYCREIMEDFWEQQ